MLGQFIDYLPDSLKDEFRERIKKISNVITMLKAGSIPQIQNIPDYFIRGIYKNRLLQTYSFEALSTVLNDMTSKLNDLGYMENLKTVLEGDADQQDWMPLHKEQSKKRKGKKKQPKSPQGIMD